MAQLTRNPTGDGTFTGTWTGTASSRYTLVDDHPDSAGTDSLTHGTTAGRGTFTYSAFDVPAGSAITNVQVLYYDQKSASQASSWGAFLSVNGADQATNDAHNPANGVWTLRTATYTQNPATSAAWTVADVNGTGSNPLQGFGVVATDASPTCRLSSIQLVVNYDPPTDEVGTIGIPIKSSGAPTPNTSHPLWQGMKYFVGLQEAGGQPFEYISRSKFLNVSGSTTWKIKQLGAAIRDTWLYYVTKADTTNVPPFTIFAVARPNTIAASARNAIAVGSNTDALIICLYNHTADWKVYMEWPTGNSAAPDVQTGGVVAGNVYAVAYTDDGVSVYTISKNLTTGAIVEQTSTTRALTGTTNQLRVGTSKYGENFIGDIFMAGFLQGRIWNQSALRAWVHDPFVLLRPPTQDHRQVKFGFGSAILGALQQVNLTATAVGVAVLANVKTFKRTLEATAVGSAVLSRLLLLQRSLSAVAVGVASQTKSMYKTLASTSVGVAVLNQARFLSQALDAVAVGVAALTSRAQYARSLVATAVGTATVSTLKTFYRSLDAVSTGVVNVQKMVSKTLGAVSTGVSSLSKGLYKTLSATASGIADLTKAPIVTRNLDAVSVGVAALANRLLYYRTLSATAVGAVALGLVKTFYKSLDAVSVGVSSLSKKMFISMSAVGTGVVSQVKKMFKALDTTSVGQVSLQTAQVVSKTLTAIAIGIVELVTQFIPGGGAPNIDAFIAFFRRRRR